MSSFVPVCASDPGPGVACPTVDLTWEPSSNFSALPELTPGEVGSLASAFLVMFAVAVGIKFVIKQFIK